MNDENSPEQDGVLVFPMSYGQSQLWYLQQMDPDSSAYHIPFGFRLTGDLDVSAIEFALQEIVNRFEPLRTVFGLIDGEPKQIVRESASIEFPVDDLAEYSQQEQQDTIEKLARKEAERPFDLRSDPMIRARLLKLGPEQNLLLIVFHHIAIDHISVLRLKNEIERIYRAVRNNLPIPDSNEELQFGDFAIWQRENMTQDFLAQKLKYWAEEFEHRSNILPLPTDRPRPPVQSFIGSEIYFSIPKDVAEPLRSLCRESGISLFVALLTALKILFYRYTGQEDITVGCPFANREKEELEEVVGLFMNLLPIASTVTGANSFSDLVQEVRKSVTRAHGHQDTPFQEIIQVSTADRDPAYNPMLQTWFTFQEAPMVLELDGLESESLRLHNGGAKLDLSFWLWESGSEIQGLIEYNSDLFDRETVVRLSDHLNTVIAGIVKEPNSRIDRLPILTLEEQECVLRTWGQTSMAIPDQSVYQQIALHAKKSPEKIAIRSDEGVFTYKELIADADKIAKNLNSLGISPGSLIAVCRHRTPSLIASLLGIWRHGSAYLPLDPGYPDERLIFMINDSEAALILCDEDTSERFHEQSVPILCTNTNVSDSDRDSDSKPASLDPTAVAYVIYTSGSTGRPKGVQVPHRAVSNLLASMSMQPGISSDDVLAAVTTISFDISVVEIFLPLTAGAQIQLISRDVAADGADLRDAMDASGSTILQATPSTYRLLIEAGWNGSESIKLLCGGETLPSDLATELVSRCSELWNMYGPTETTVWSTVSRIGGATEEITIGKPIANTIARVLDETGKPTPIGVPGELFIGGLGLANGYLDRPELDEERFILATIDTQEERLYKTGDRVRWNSDGNLVHMGRNDRQVKLRGFRIELEEIENTIMESTEGLNVAVTIWSPNSADLRLVAYIVSINDNPPSSMELRKLLRRQLPEFMIPQHFVQLAEMPLTANGKVDRKRLPNPTVSTEATDKPAPETDSEKMVAAVWAEILGIDNISKDDNFFDIGGHSLLAMKAIATIESRTSVKMTARMIVMQSLAELAEKLDIDSETPFIENRQHPEGLVG